MRLGYYFQWIVIVGLLATACSPSRQRLDVAAKNQTGVALDKVNIRFGQHNSYKGILSPDALAVHMYFEAKIGDSAEVTWVGRNGETNQQIVSLVGIYDEQKPGRLTFDIGKSNVVVRFEELK